MPQLLSFASMTASLVFPGFTWFERTKAAKSYKVFAYKVAIPMLAARPQQWRQDLDGGVSEMRSLIDPIGV